MKLSFNSFETIAKNHEGLPKRIANLHDYKAHTHKVLAAETLEEHIVLVNKYALTLIETHGLEPIINNLIEQVIDIQLFKENDIKIGNFIKTLFLMSIEFHDYGKINPNFQLDRMENSLFKGDTSIKIGSQHSRLSAYLFYNHFVYQLENADFSEDEMVFLGVMTFLFTNPILKHHAGYFEHDSFWDKDINKSIHKFLEKVKIPVSDDSLIEIYDDWKEQISHFYKPKSYFPIFALLKLNFSLLTASDYLATGDFMNGLPITDFGIATKERKTRWYKDFWESTYAKKEEEKYNKDLKDRFEFYKNLNFSDLQDRNKDNLNFLRQKLSAEVLDNVRQNLNANLFYLEAPTGAGKTNMSMAVALELLKENENLNKITYVFPFNTLITQTYQGIIDMLGLKEDEIIQLHSKSGFHQKKDAKTEKEGEYGNEKLNFIDNLFIHYPITLLSHIRFFDILKGNGKETNYVLHRLSNSVIIIDELQAYNPQHWDKVILLLHEYARYFNFKVIMMSATLPHLDDLLPDESMKGKIKKLVTSKKEFFTNPNFAGRVHFDFELKNREDLKQIDREIYLEKLRDFMLEKSEEYANNNNEKVRVIIEFIKKKSASEFLQSLEKDERFLDYQKYIISGEILETRRQQIIRNIKENVDNKVILVSTQVIEAGVNIDMDLGFKDTSLVDSDEQLAGRVNRNASKQNSKVYIFDFDNEKSIYGSDLRYKMKLENTDYEYILKGKDFELLYKKVKDFVNKNNKDDNKVDNLLEYLEHFRKFKFMEIHQKFKLIDEANTSVFIPLDIPFAHFDNQDKALLAKLNISPDEDANISGTDVWDKYYEIIVKSKAKLGDFIKNKIELKQVNGLLSKFMFSVYEKQVEDIQALGNWDKGIFDGFKIIYITSPNEIYDYEQGFKLSVINLKRPDGIFL